MKSYILLLIQVLFLDVWSHSSVYILNQHRQLVTSSALQWVKSRDGEPYIGSVPGGRNGSELLSVCRALSGGEYLVGQMNDLGCLVVVGRTSHITASNYEVLINVDMSARLEWVNWKQFSEVPIGGVSANSELFVAREILPQNSTHNEHTGKPSTRQKTQFIGGLNLQDNYGTITFPPMGRRATAGQILIEIDPIRYDLKYFRQLKIRNIHSSDVKLNKTIELQSGWPEVRADEGRVVNYTYQEVVYFGKGHNLQTGVPVRILFENGTHLDIRWGLPTEVIVSHKLRMNYHDLPPGSSVTASIMATKIDRKLDYTATLVAHYLDGTSTSRTIQGVYRQVVMEHLRPVFGLPMFPPDKTSPYSFTLPVEEITESSTAKEIISKSPLSANKVRHLHGNRQRPSSKLSHNDDHPENHTMKAAVRYEVDALDNELRMPRDNDFEKVSKITYVDTSASNSFAVQIKSYLIITLVTVYKFVQ